MEEGRLLMTMKMKIKATLNQNATRMLQEEEQSDLEGKNGCIIYTYELIWRQSDLEGGKKVHHTYESECSTNDRSRKKNNQI
jgi:hypothetical protein